MALSGRTSFDWHESGAFLIMRNEIDDPRFPDGVAIIGSDDGAGTFAMSYFDERAVSRLFKVTVGEGGVGWRRDDAEFAQSVVIEAQGEGRLVSTGRMSVKGGPWTDDLSQVFEREG